MFSKDSRVILEFPHQTKHKEESIRATLNIFEKGEHKNDIIV